MREGGGGGGEKGENFLQAKLFQLFGIMQVHYLCCPSSSNVSIPDKSHVHVHLLQTPKNSSTFRILKMQKPLS